MKCGTYLDLRFQWLNLSLTTAAAVTSSVHKLIHGLLLRIDKTISYVLLSAENLLGFASAFGFSPNQQKQWFV